MSAKISPSSDQIFLFTGEDDFSLKRRLDFWKEEFAKKYPHGQILVFDAENLENQSLSHLEEAVSPSLFSDKKLIILKNYLPTKATDADFAEKLLGLLEKIPQDLFLIFWQTVKLDGRLNLVKKFLKHPKIKTVQFALPHGRELNAWLKQEAAKLGVGIEEEAVEL